MRFSEVHSTTKLGNSEACHKHYDVTICDSFNTFYTELRELKYKLRSIWCFMCSLVEILCVLEGKIWLVCWQLLYDLHATDIL